MFKWMRYKREKAARLRANVQKYGLVAENCDLHGWHEEAKMYRRIALQYQKELHAVTSSKLSNLAMYRKDKREQRKYESYYVSAVEIFA